MFQSVVMDDAIIRVTCAIVDEESNDKWRSFYIDVDTDAGRQNDVDAIAKQRKGRLSSASVSTQMLSDNCICVDADANAKRHMY